MKKMMISITAVLAALTVVLIMMYVRTDAALLLTLSITAGTILYHFAMRLIVGGLYNVFMNQQADYSRQWYQLWDWEKKLYTRLQVKKWKKHMPTFDPELFDPRIHSWSEIAQAMCQAELVHRTIALLSFLPVLASVWFGAIGVFITTSVIACVIDLCFVIMQRYNRARVVRLEEQMNHRITA